MQRGRYARSRVQLDLIHENKSTLRAIGYRPKIATRVPPVEDVQRELKEASEENESLQKQRDEKLRDVATKTTQVENLKTEYDTLKAELQRILKQNEELRGQIDYSQQGSAALELARSQTSASIAALKDEILSARMNPAKTVPHDTALSTEDAENRDIPAQEDVSDQKDAEVLVQEADRGQDGRFTEADDAEIQSHSPVAVHETPGEVHAPLSVQSEMSTLERLAADDVVELSSDAASVLHIESGVQFRTDILRRVVIDKGQGLRKAKVPVLKDLCHVITHGEISYRPPKDVTINLLYEYAVQRTQSHAEHDTQPSTSAEAWSLPAEEAVADETVN